MKQTNNAIKFLMAQYRAIFKNAYFKGIASAVLLTAGLAVAGNAQATDYDETTFPTIGSESVTWDPAADKIVIEDGPAQGSIDNTNAFDIVIGSTGNKIQGSGAATAASGVTVNALQGKITLSGSSTPDFLIKGADGKVATFNLNSFGITKGTLTLDSAATAATGAATLNANTIVLGAANAGDAKITFSDNNTAAVAAVLQGKLTNANGGTGTIEFSGAGTLKTYTDDTGAKADINVAAEASGTLDLSGDDETKKLLRLNDGTFTITGHGTAGSGAAFTVKHGTLAVDNAVFLTAGTTGDTDAGELVLNADTAGDDATDAVLRVSSAQLKSFLTVDKGIGVTDGTDDKAGIVTLTKGTIELTDPNEVDVSALTIKANGSTDKGSIVVGTDADHSIIKGNTLSIKTDALKEITALTVQADTLKLTELDDATNQLFKGKTIAANYDVTLNKTAASDGTAADNAYTVSHEMGWLSTTEVNNPYHVANNKPVDPEKITVAANGTIGHDYIVTSGAGLSGDFHIMGGHYTDANDIELKNGGKLTVGGATTGQGVGIDASLTLTSAGSLTLNNKGTSGTNNEITIAGNAASTEHWHNQNASVTGDTNVTFTPESVLDLSQGTIKFAYDGNAAPTDDHKVQTNITVGSNGELIVRDDQMDYLLNNLRTLEQRNEAVSGAAINLSGGTVTVKGDLNLDIDNFSTSADTGNKIHFDTTGGILAADNIVIEENESNPADTSDSGTALDLGANGTLKAETITLNNRNISSDASKGFVDYQITAGNLEVGSALSSVNSTVIFGNGTSGASLTLGYIDPNLDKYRIREDGTYNLSAETGTVQPNLKLNGGTTGSESKLTVTYGDWTIQDLDASKAIITVGDNNHKYDADGNVYTTSLTGQGLTLNTGADMTVYDNGTATFETLKLAGGTIDINNTTMTINGKHTEATSSVDESWGLEVTGGKVTVNGREGVLAIGAEALSSVSATKNTDGTFALANELPVSGFVDLKNWATLSLELDSNDVFGEASLEALRQAFISGSNGSPVNEGYIDIGAARIDGITVTNGEVSWNEMQKYKDIIADIVSADTSNATLVDVTSATPKLLTSTTLPYVPVPMASLRMRMVKTLMLTSILARV